MIESADIFRRSFSRVLLARRPAAKDQSTRLVVFRVKLRGIYSPQVYTDECHQQAPVRADSRTADLSIGRSEFICDLIRLREFGWVGLFGAVY
jgi:hypothetical protein